MPDGLFPGIVKPARTTKATKPVSHRSKLGQFMTPPPIAKFMAGLFSTPLSKTVRLLDAGAGRGSLTSAFVHRWQQEADRGSLAVDAYEVDPALVDELGATLQGFEGQAKLTTRLIAADFIEKAAWLIKLEQVDPYTHGILNPPYKKINSASLHRGHLRAAGLETVNLYSGFVGLAVELLEQGGEIVAIIPRSFCNGPYYQPFRRYVLDRAALRHIHLFDARNKAFKDDGVLQENIIIHMVRGAAPGPVKISTSRDDSFDDYNEAIYPLEKILLPDDTEQFIHIPSKDDVELLETAAFQHRLSDIGVSVSTGPVVDFRMREDLRNDPEPGTVPLLYPGHFHKDVLEWPRPGFKKSNAIRHTQATEKWLYPTGFYAVVRRFSSKEERRRIVANVVDPAKLDAPMIGLENHLNVFHEKRRPISEELARGLSVYLNSTVVDRYFRRFNGHTQVNATDLKTMKYPSRETLTKLGVWAKRQASLSQESIDERVSQIT